MERVALLAAANSEANQWLAQHPAALGLMMLAIGLAVGGWGLFELKKGVSYSKLGHEVKGPPAKAAAIVTIVIGAVAALLGLSKLLFG